MIYSRRVALALCCLATTISITAAHEITLMPTDTHAERHVATAPHAQKSKKEKKQHPEPIATPSKRTDDLVVAEGCPEVTQSTQKKPYYNRNRVKPSNRKKWVAQKNKTLSDMNFEELKVAKNRAVKAKNNEVALKYMQKMLPLCNDLVEHATLMLETADTLLETGAIKEASSMYQDFSTMYPGHDRITYASFKAIECSYATVLIPERDQTATLTTIERAEAFLNNSNPTLDYYEQVKTILHACYKIRLDSEISIINFFLHQKNIAAAQKRIEHIRETQLPIFPAAEKELIEVECLLASTKNDTELLLQKQTELATKFPAPASFAVASNKRRVDQVAKF
ncbi:outer membrane protein assembly factor BamD [Candidatus Dependentiae bacterium]|nr:outer membrane protein assembly factor BamD [Candidatus Dependentiae bacterium]MCC7415242.1 outer membrane protein assembly factor BamD [Campylobacterota bacterium]